VPVPGFGEYRDEEGAPFYCSRERDFATPENTYAEILRRFTAVVRNGIHMAYKKPQPIELEQLVDWHRSIFASTFPHQAGVLRAGPSFFGTRWNEDGRSRRRMVEGAAPERVRDELRIALGRYNGEIRTRPPERRLYREGLTTAAELYAEILRIHPFEDGNLRTAFPALQVALISLGVRPVDFEGEVERHDAALGWALKDVDTRTAEPFVDFLDERIQTASQDRWWDVP
jgi:fido (protein-threonine AMPylation protein)